MTPGGGGGASRARPPRGSPIVTKRKPAELTDGREPIRPVAPPPKPAPEPEPAPPTPSAAAVRQGGPERVTWVDWVILALAVVSLGLVIVEQSFPSYFSSHPEARQWLIWADLGICGVFFIEFVARMRHQVSKWAYVKSRWYDILGMIPVSHPFFRGFRLLRILRIAVITSRFVRATNRTFGEMAFEATVRRFRDILIEEVTDAVVLRSLSMVEPWLVRARFADRIGEAMEERRAEIRRLVREAMGRVPGATMMLRVGPFRNMVDTAENAAVQAVIDTLRSEELNRLIQEATANVLDEIKEQVAVKEHQREDR